MGNYEPELMYALDSKSEYSDWKNVYNVSGSDVLYCPICLGRVKLWNGQDPDKTYKKQRCFHHIDGMCSQESRIHFAYKTWLLKKGSKFKVGESVYEVDKSEIEKTLHTEFGIYRPDILVETTDNKTFYIEIADTNKKTDDYIEKWDELGCDVLELDVNEQLIKTTINDIPEFKIIYSSATGECYIKHYTRQDYDNLITERKIYWKRNNLLQYKIQWERLDWFWRSLQDFYINKADFKTLIQSFKQMDPSDQRFVCQRMRGKHLSLKYELEKNYTDTKDLSNAQLKHISLTIRKLNKEFGYSSCDEFDDTYLFRKDRHVIFKDASNWEDRTHYYIQDDTTEEDIYNYFHPVMEDFYNSYTVEFKEKIKKKKMLQTQFCDKYINKLESIKNRINESKYNYWKMKYYIESTYSRCCVIMTLLNEWDEYTYVNMEKQTDWDIEKDIVRMMKNLLSFGKEARYKHIRIMEER